MSIVNLVIDGYWKLICRCEGQSLMSLDIIIIIHSKWTLPDLCNF